MTTVPSARIAGDDAVGPPSGAVQRGAPVDEPVNGLRPVCAASWPRSAHTGGGSDGDAVADDEDDDDDDADAVPLGDGVPVLLDDALAVCDGDGVPVVEPLALAELLLEPVPVGLDDAEPVWDGDGVPVDDALPEHDGL